jgi:hypothetical protein
MNLQVRHASSRKGHTSSTGQGLDGSLVAWQGLVHKAETGSVCTALAALAAVVAVAVGLVVGSLVDRSIDRLIDHLCVVSLRPTAFSFSLAAAIFAVIDVSLASLQPLLCSVATVLIDNDSGPPQVSLLMPRCMLAGLPARATDCRLGASLSPHKNQSTDNESSYIRQSPRACRPSNKLHSRLDWLLSREQVVSGGRLRLPARDKVGCRRHGAVRLSL